MNFKSLYALCSLLVVPFFTSITAQETKPVWVFVGATYNAETSTPAEASYTITADAAAFGSDAYRVAIQEITGVNNSRAFKSGGKFTLPEGYKAIELAVYGWSRYGGKTVVRKIEVDGAAVATFNDAESPYVFSDLGEAVNDVNRTKDNCIILTLDEVSRQSPIMESFRIDMSGETHVFYKVGLMRIREQAGLASLTIGGTAHLSGYKVSYSVEGTSAETTATLHYTKEDGKNVTLALSAPQTSPVKDPAELGDWSNTIPSSLVIPEAVGSTSYYYLRSSLDGLETIYYEIEVIRRSVADVVYRYDLSVNPITSEEDPTLSNIVQNTSGYHSHHGWRFNYASGSTLKVKVTGDAIVELGGSAYNNPELARVTASADNPAIGSIVPNCKVTAVNGGMSNRFYYAGGANTLTFTYEDVCFCTSITINNEGSGKADLRAVFVGETELALKDFTDGICTLKNLGYLPQPSGYAFPGIAFAMKNPSNAPTATGSLNTISHYYVHSFEYEGGTYEVRIPYESEIGYSVNNTEKRYEISTSFGLKTVADMINKGTAAYKTIYLPNGTYDFGVVEGGYLNGFTISASGVTLVGESQDARIIGLFGGITSSIMNLTGDNITVRTLTLAASDGDKLVGLRGVSLAAGTSGDNIFFDRVKLIGGQDTYCGGSNKDAGCKHLFYECTIVGTVDFICSGGDKTVDYFLRCDIQFREGGVMSAPMGQVYLRDCSISDFLGSAKSANKAFSLGRPWRDTGKVFAINTTFNILPDYGFVGMSGGVFPAGSAGTAGNLNPANGTLFEIANPAQDPQPLPMTEATINTYTSIYTMCGPTLAALTSEPVTIPASQYTTLCAADALVVPDGVAAYIVESVENGAVKLSKAYSSGETIPACTPVLLKAEVNEETVFQFAYAPKAGSITPEKNLLSGSLVHQDISSGNLFTYNAATGTFSKQNGNVRIKANTAYLVLDNVPADHLPLTDPVGILAPSIDKEVESIYDLQGRPASNPQEGQIYIVNREKELIR